VLKYDDVLNRQREAIYTDRRHILEGDDLKDRVARFLDDVVNEVIEVSTAEGHSDDWDFDALWTELKTIYPISITVDEVLTEAGTRGRITDSFLKKEILSDARIAYQRREMSLGEQAMRELERRVVLSVIDRRWRDHLYEMDYLKDGIGLRAMAQRDPLVEYQREGFALYQQMMGSIREESVGFLFNLEVEVTGGSAVAARGLQQPTQPANSLSYAGPSADAAGGVEVRNQRGQVEQAATARAQQAAAQQQAAAESAFRQQQPAPAAQAPASTGAFGQKTGGPAAAGPPPVNRAQRRAQEKRKGH
jgi:preprotein translocase subunit SecA